MTLVSFQVRPTTSWIWWPETRTSIAAARVPCGEFVGVDDAPYWLLVVERGHRGLVPRR